MNDRFKWLTLGTCFVSLGFEVMFTVGDHHHLYAKVLTRKWCLLLSYAKCMCVYNKQVCSPLSPVDKTLVATVAM